MGGCIEKLGLFWIDGTLVFHSWDRDLGFLGTRGECRFFDSFCIGSEIFLVPRGYAICTLGAV